VAGLGARGHAVPALARSPEKVALVRSLGAEPVEISLFDPAALAGVVAGHDAVVNLATKIPTGREALTPAGWSENDRIRTEGAANLAAAAIAAGAQVYVQESIAFLYGDHGSEVVDAESTPIVPSPFSDAVHAAEAAAATVAETGARGVVLRFGMFWSHDSAHTRMFLGAARRGLLLDGGRGDGYFPMIDADDAADAVVAAVERAPSGVYDVVAESRPRREVAAALATAVGRRRVRRPPVPGLRRQAPHLTWSQRVRGHAFTDATGWRPAAADDVAIVAKVARDARVEPSMRRGARLLLWYLALGGTAVGTWALFAPRSFYDDFPFGRGWVAADGPYNEHLVRDVGAFNLALLVATLVALGTSHRVTGRAAAAGWFVYSLPHAVYHSFHLHGLGTADQVGVMLSVWAIPLVALAAWRKLANRRQIPASQPGTGRQLEHGAGVPGELASVPPSR
jgi:nucleoside-diphosphate-sugar epimerase